MKTIPLLILLPLATAAPADEASLEEALNQALHIEIVNLDPDAAVARYTRIVESFDPNETPAEQKAFAATAFIRLAGILESQKRDEEAAELYRGFLNHFRDQKAQAEFVRERLGIGDFGSRQKLTEVTEDEEIELSEHVFREVWKFSRRMRPDELVLTTFEVEHDDDYANEGLPPGFSVRALHYAPSGRITKWLSRTQVHWTEEENRKRFEEKEKEGLHEYHGPDRWNCITGFGQSFVVPEGLHWSGGGWGDAYLGFFFSDEYSVKKVESSDYEKVKATKGIKVSLKFESISRERAERLLAMPLKLELPEMGDEAWSQTLPPSLTEIEGGAAGE